MYAPPPPITPTQHQVIVGSLFGDGSVVSKANGRAFFSEGHCSAQEMYLRWKAEVLRSLYAKVNLQKNGKFQMWTPSLAILQPYREVFYPEGVKIVPPQMLADVGPLALAVWCMDDGWWCERRFSIATDGFTRPGDQQSILDHIERAFGVRGRIQATPKGHHRVTFSVSESMKLLRVVSPHVMEPFRRKWRLDDEATFTRRERPVRTPDGVFESLTEAGARYGVTKQAILWRATTGGWDGWVLLDKDVVGAS